MNTPHIPQWYIEHLLLRLVKELSSPVLPMTCNDPREWCWQIKDTDKQFIVYVEDKTFKIEILLGQVLKSYDETDDPEEVIQAAKKFKSDFALDILTAAKQT